MARAPFASLLLLAAWPALPAAAARLDDARRIGELIAARPGASQRTVIDPKTGRPCAPRRNWGRAELVREAAQLPAAERSTLLMHLHDAEWLRRAGLGPEAIVPGCGCTVNIPGGGFVDIGVAKSAVPPSLLAGDNVTYPITVRNFGSTSSGTISLVDALPAPLAFVSVIPGAPDCANAGNTVNCSLGGLNAGGVTSVSITASIPAGASSATVTNTATATASGDTYALNDSGSAALVITARQPGRTPEGSFRLAKSAAPGQLDLSWGAACGSDVSGYALFEGALGQFYSHALFNAACGVTGTALNGQDPGAGSRYYLVAPVSTTEEGSLGTDSAGDEIPPASDPCRPARDVSACS